MPGPRQPSLNSECYIELCLNDHVMNYAHFIGEEFIFMTDNTRGHTAAVIRDYLFEVGTLVKEWPVRNPGMNIQKTCME